jgi:hypothetical protein
VAALAGRVSAGGAERAEVSFAGWQVHVCRLCIVCMCVAADEHDCGWSHLGVAGARPFHMLQCPVAAGSPSYDTGAAVCTLLRVQSLEMGPRVHVELSKSGIVSVGTVSVTRRSRSQVESLCMFLCCFDLSKPSTFTCTIPMCTWLRLKISFPPPVGMRNGIQRVHDPGPPHMKPVYVQIMYRFMYSLCAVYVQFMYHYK